MDKRVTLIHADCRAALSVMPDASVDAIVTDPPYEIGFNRERWDSTGVAMSKALWSEVLRVAKPGSCLLAFGATRTYHRMASAIEDAGFELTDCVAWLYGNGFPKHRSKLKPAWEPVVLARRKAAKATTLNIAGAGLEGDRWPANVVLDEAAAALLNKQRPKSERPSRFFYVPKATTDEREEGLAGAGLRKKRNGVLSGLKKSAKPRANHHPTVKPIELMRHLVRLVTPADGVVLDPFTGSGSTGCAAVVEGKRFVGIEKERTYFAIAEARIRHWANHV
jgi:site-specific DNA-methyltransferase (adenine-specific)